MSETVKKTYLGGLYVGTLSVMNVIISYLFSFSEFLDKSVANAISPFLASGLTYLIVVYLFSGFLSLEEADKRRSKGLKKKNLDEHRNQIQEKLTKINSLLENNRLSDRDRRVLEDRYSTLLLESIE